MKQIEEKSFQFPTIKINNKPVSQKIDQLHNKMKRHFTNQHMTFSRTNSKLIDEVQSQIQKGKIYLAQLKNQNNADEERQKLMIKKNQLICQVKSLIKQIEKTKSGITKLNFKEQQISNQVGSKTGILVSLNSSISGSRVKYSGQLDCSSSTRKDRDVISKTFQRSQSKQNKWDLIQKMIDKIENMSISKIQKLICRDEDKQNSRKLFKNYNLDNQFELIMATKQFQQQIKKMLKIKNK